MVLEQLLGKILNMLPAFRVFKVHKDSKVNKDSKDSRVLKDSKVLKDSRVQ